MDREELKQGCLNVIEEHRDEVIVLGKEAYRAPELGFKEFRTGKLVEEALCKFGLEPETGVSYTGYHVSSGPRGNGPGAAVMGELDCTMCNSHPNVAEGGVVHACRHNVQLVNMYGAVVGILTSGVMEHLGGAADFVAILAEECMDYECRSHLMSQGTIHYLGGKQELMYRGGLDDMDMALQHHMVKMEPGKRRTLNTRGNGFINKTVHFLEKMAHAGLTPKQEIDALNVVELAMSNIHALRETFRDRDEVRVSIVIKEDEGLVDVVPERVTMGIMVRTFTIDAMEDASHKMNRSMRAVAITLGGKVGIHGCIGYLPPNTDRQIARLYRDDMMTYKRAGEDAFVEDWETAGSTGLGDISQIMSYMHTWTGDIRGGLHAGNYRMDDPYTTYIMPAKMVALTIIGLLWDEGAKGKEVIRGFRSVLTKEEYLNLLKDHRVVDLYNAPDL